MFTTWAVAEAAADLQAIERFAAGLFGLVGLAFAVKAVTG